MPTIHQIRGALFEEVVLFLLKRSGFTTIDDTTGDETLKGPRGYIKVIGRGGCHQIDAIADYVLPRPFSHPARLLVEAKCYSSKIDMATVRNTVGVLKDVSEAWATADGPIPQTRYHYQAAIFSATAFTRDAERYAFAQDIYLFPLEQSAFFGGVIAGLKRIQGAAFGTRARKNISVDLSALRIAVRDVLRGDAPMELIFDIAGGDQTVWDAFIAEAQGLAGVLLAIVGKTFPLFLVPARRVVLDELGERERVELVYSGGGWLVRREGETLFSFDLPPRLLELYAKDGVLDRRRRAALEGDWFGDLEATLVDSQGRPRWIVFDLDEGWLGRLRMEASRRAGE